MDTHKLMPCPCCGSCAVFERIDDANSNYFWGEYVVCISCGISTGLVFSCVDDAKQRLLDVWNKRAPNVKLTGRARAANYEVNPDSRGPVEAHVMPGDLKIF